MDSECCMHQSKKSEPKDEIDGAEVTKPKVEQSLGPTTPDSTKEDGDFPLDLSSPLTGLKKLPKVFSFSSKRLASIDNSTSPRTPKDVVFDPFAPGPDDMILAPQCKKYFDEARASVARRLSFDSPFKAKQNSSSKGDAESFTDQDMFESVYENLLEAIVFNQTEGVLAEMSNLEWDSDDCRTPPSGPQLTGVAETCPGAPLRPIRKSKIIDLGLCRKLEF